MPRGTDSRRPLKKRQRLLIRWGALSLVALAALSILAIITRPTVDVGSPNADGSIDGLTSVLSRDVTSEMVRFRFEDERANAGIDFLHFPAARNSLLPEDMGSGVAWGDYDGDGDPDLFLVNFRGSILETDVEPPAGHSALYRNNGDGTFTDVTIIGGLSRATYGMGASWADYDSDDDVDLFLTNYGPNVLYRNDGDGTFTDVTEQAGVVDDRFSAGSSWSDYDNDGDIDLYVTTYVDFVYRETDYDQVTRHYGSETPFTLNPSTYSPATNRLYRNNGDGTFTDAAPDTPVANPTGRSLGAAWFDFDLDGFVDLYVANDVSDNGVYRNLGNGTFENIGPRSLAADYRGAMGLAVGDYEKDGDLDLFVTHWIAQENAFFENMHAQDWKDAQGARRLFFMDSAETIGLGQISLKMVGWSTGFADLDNDGYLDLWVVNGNTLEKADDNRHLRPQMMQLFRQDKDRGFFEIGQQASTALTRPIVGRGGAHADYDGDGRMDLAVMAHGEQPLLLHNTSTNDNHWIALRLRQRGGNTQALGARIVVTSGESTQLAQVCPAGAYLSQNSTDVHFGLGAEIQIDEIEIRWPDGTIEKHVDVPPDQILKLTHDANYP